MSSGAYPAAASGSDGGGAFGTRPRRRLLIAVAAVVIAAAAVAAGILIGRGGGTHSASARNSSYGAYPSWLPHTQLPPVNDVLQSTAAHPKLDAIEGNTIEVHLAGGEAAITAVGPAFPPSVSAAVQSGTLPEGSAVPTTFTVTLIDDRGTVPLSPLAFSILTAGGQLIHPSLTAPGGKPAPATLRSGQHLNLTLKANLVEGDGSLRWAPSGPRVMAGWLYQLELD